MVHQDGGQGTLILDIRLGKLGRYKRASGTTDPALFADVRRSLRLLRDAHPPRYDVLALLVSGEFSPLEIHDAYIHGTLGQLPTSDELRLLEDVVRKWLRTLDRSAVTVDGYASSLLGLVGPHVTLAHLPALVAERRAQALGSGKRRTFNVLLTAARMLLRGVVGERHRLYDELARIQALRVTRRKGNPQSVEQIRALAVTLGTHGSDVWSLALSGMRRGEYFGNRWRLLSDRIAIEGTKTAAAVREAPRVYPISAPTCGYDRFNAALREATSGQVRTHDLRYTWMRWLEEAGVPQIRVNYYAGHTVKDVGELYRRGRGFAEHLAKDAERVREWMGDPPGLGLRVVEAR